MLEHYMYIVNIKEQELAELKAIVEYREQELAQLKATMIHE